MRIPSVVQACANPDYTITVFFDDGKVVRYDIKPLLSRGGVFETLKNKDFFREAITVLNGTVAWSRTLDGRDCIDLDPVVLYEQGTDVTDEAIRAERLTELSGTESA